jgi:hypothetical protein
MRHARLCCCLLLVLAHLSCVLSEITLTNYKKVRDSLPLLSRNPNFTKAWYFEQLESRGIVSGPQTDPNVGLCPFANGRHELLTPTCLRDGGFKYIVFIGDSLMRELAWSFARLSSSVPGEACQQGAVLHKRFNNTGDGPSFGCRVASTDAHTLCGVEDQLGNNIADCCSGKFQSFYYGYVRPWAGEKTQFKSDGETTQTIQMFQDSCPCKGLVVLNFGMWLAIDNLVVQRTGNDPPPWSLPFGRRAGWKQLIEQWHKPGSLLHTVIASTAHVNNHIMTLEPPKDEWDRWNYLALEFMATVDRDVARSLNFSYAPYYEVRHYIVAPTRVKFVSFPPRSFAF